MSQIADERPVFRGELALALVAVFNSFMVVLLLHSGFGISTVSSVPYTLSRLVPALSLGTWNYLFQSALVVSLMVVRRRFVPLYLLSFVVGIVFGVTMDLHQAWVQLLPQTLPLRVVYLAVSLVGMAFGISLSNHCKLPIIPTDLFPRELTLIFHLPYRAVKTTFDLLCFLFTAGLSLLFFRDLEGLGAGTVLSALLIGSIVAKFDCLLDRRFRFVSFLEPDGSGDAPKLPLKNTALRS